MLVLVVLVILKRVKVMIVPPSVYATVLLASGCISLVFGKALKTRSSLLAVFLTAMGAVMLAVLYFMIEAITK